MMRYNAEEAEQQYEKYLQWNLSLLHRCRFWPREKHWSKLKCFLYELTWILQFCWIISVILFQCLKVVEVWGDLWELTQVFTHLTTATILTQKNFTLVRKRNRIKSLEHIMRELWIENWMIADNNTREQMIRAASRSKKVSLIYFFSASFTIATFCIGPIKHLIWQELNNVPIENRTFLLPYFSSVSLFLDMSVTVNYVFSYIYVAAVGITCTLYTSCSNTFFIVSVGNICLQLKLLSQQIQEIVMRGAKLGIRSKGRSPLGDWIEIHKSLIRASSIINELYSPIILFQCLTITIGLCLMIFQMVTSTEFGSFILFAGYMIFVLGETTIFCWFGQVLIDESNAISFAVYNTKWYEANKTLNHELLIILKRAQKPIYITAGGFYAVSLELFKSILSTTMSYFTLLRRVSNR